MRIAVDGLETFVVRLPARADFRWLSLTRPLGEFVLARVEANGVEGWGEVVSLPDWGDVDGRRHGETPATVTAVVHEQIAPWLLAEEFLLGELGSRLDELIIGHPYAKALVEIAVHDLVGRQRGVPVYDLLGGAARERVPVAHMIGLMPVNDALREATTAVADGICALQIKGGREPECDVALVRSLRAELGDGVHLRVDANGGYRERAVALRTLAALADAGADLVEQPTLGVAELAELRRTSRLPLMADEACWTPGDALELVRCRAIDAVSVYVGKAGGIARARTLCALAAAAGLPHDLNGALELGIGNAANLHVALSSTAHLLPSVIPINAPAGSFTTTTAGRYFEDDVVAEPFTYTDGSLGATDAPGLGVTVDREKVEHYCVDRRLSAGRRTCASE
jgi:L-alanine-DL-glutamate epimerase-like enolase superfamily enzyme